MKKIDWDKIKTEYTTTKISIKKLSEKYNVKFNTMQGRSRREKWGNERKENVQKVYKKCTKKTIDFLASKKTKTIINHFKIADKFSKEINKALSNNQELYTFVDGFNIEKELNTINDKKISNLVSSIEKLQKMQRQSLELYDNKDIREKELEHKHWLEKEKLKLQKEEFEYKKWLEKEKLKKGDLDVDEEDDGFIEALGIATEESWKDVEIEEKEE